MTKLETVEWGRLHYSSSADRGLNNILYLMPFLLHDCPELKLHVYYGFETWEAAARSRGNEQELAEINSIKSQMAALGDRVVVHGRISQAELAKEWKKAWCWFMPEAFTETYSITAVEAQLSATPILCSNVAALQTTVGEFGIRVQHHPYSKEGREEYLVWLKKLYHDREFWQQQSDLSLRGSKRRFGWPERWVDFWEPLTRGVTPDASRPPSC